MATTSCASRSFPTLRYAAAPFRWCFGSRRRVLTAMAVLLAMAAAPVVWWNVQLMGLPDIGDPFDVESFRSATIPDDQNAFVIYREATDRFTPLDRSLASAGTRFVNVLPMVSGALEIETPARLLEEKLDLLAAWSKADPRVRRWADENHEALALYRRGSERPDALDPGRAGPPNRRSDEEMRALRSLHLLALLEASRLEERGDMAEALGWYRTALRASYHFGLRGAQIHRVIADRWRGELLARLTAWSADRRTTPAMVRQALDDVIACQGLAPWDTYTIKADYPYALQLLDSPQNPGRQVPTDKPYDIFGSSDYQLNPEQVQAIFDSWRFWRREPERSRRVIRLAFANWLAYYELPTDRRPKRDPDVSGPLPFYAFGPEAPANARALSSEALDRWLATTTDATPMLREWNLAAIRAKEVRGYRALMVLLASELYRRHHGAAPLSDEALVGPYVEELPDDGLGDPSVQPGPAPAKPPAAGRSTGRE
jgi:hypothetical protein